MKTTFVGKENNQVTFTIEFTAEEFDAATQKVYLRQRGSIAVDGFRKGKAPRSIIEKKYGTGVFFEDALDDLLRENYPAALDELKIEPIDNPDVEFGDEKLEQHKGFTTTFKVSVAPEIELGEYKGIEVPFKEYKIADEDVNLEIENLRRRNARLVDTEIAENGDTVDIDYAGFIGEDQFAGGTAENYSLKLGSGTFIPGFEDQLIGVKAGDEKDVVVSFPEDYSAENLAGKEAVFKCKVHGVKREELPELDDEFAKDVSEFDTLDELKASTKERLEKTAADQNEYTGKNAALLKLCELNPVDIPQVMIDDEVNQMYSDYLQRLVNQGISADAVKKYMKNSEESIKENFKADATARVHANILMNAVIAKENIEATDEELEAEFENMSKQYQMSVEEVKKAMAGSESVIKEDIAYRKAVQFIYDNAKFVEPEEAPEEVAEETPAEE